MDSDATGPAWLRWTLGMSSTYTPLGFYLQKVHADRDRELMVQAGLNATVRPAGDDPPGYRTAPGQYSFVLWVEGVERTFAEETFHRVVAEAFPPTYCEVCGINPARHTLEIISAGIRTKRELCAKCFRERSA